MKWLPGERCAVACSGKIKYESGCAAARSRQIMKKNRRKQSHVSVYRCYFCGFWHLGRATKNPKPPKEKYRLQITLHHPD